MSPRPLRPHLEALDDRVLLSGMPALAMGSTSIVEGNAGTQYAAVVVSPLQAQRQTVTVSYGTADGTATTAGNDYLATSGKLSFAPGQTSKTILVPVLGDRIGEADESFSVKLHGAKNAKIAGGRGVVTILDDEPRLRIGDVAIAEGNDGTRLFTFTVSLSAACDQAVTVDFATQDGSALAGEDYVATSGTLTFAPGETTRTITVAVLGGHHARAGRDLLRHPQQREHQRLDHRGAQGSRGDPGRRRIPRGGVHV